MRIIVIHSVLMVVGSPNLSSFSPMRLYSNQSKAMKTMSKSMLHANVNVDAPVAIGDAMSVKILPTTCVADEKSSMRKNIHAIVTNTNTKIFIGSCR